MLTKNKTKFINDIWVTGYYEGLKVIGRTYMFREQQMVAIVTEISTINDIQFSELQEVKALAITASGSAQPVKRKPILAKGLARQFINNMNISNLN
jgi:hypothetical protein